MESGVAEEGVREIDMGRLKYALDGRHMVSGHLEQSE